MARVAWIEDHEATGELAELYAHLFVRLADAFDIHPDPATDPTGPPGVLRQP